MPTDPTTQAFIDEVRNPGAVTPANIRNAIAAFVPQAGKTGQQVERWAELLAAAEIAEPDNDVRAVIEEGFQKIGALRRQRAESERHLRDMARTLVEIQEWYAERFRPAAEAAGYTV